MAEYHVPFKFDSEEEARKALDEAIAKHKDVIMVGCPTIVDSEEHIRAIVHEELAAFKADIVNQVMSDLAKEMHLQQRGSHER